MDEKDKWSMQYMREQVPGAKLPTDNSVWPYSADFLLTVYLNEVVSKLLRFTVHVIWVMLFDIKQYF